MQAKTVSSRPSSRSNSIDFSSPPSSGSRALPKTPSLHSRSIEDQRNDLLESILKKRDAETSSFDFKKAIESTKQRLKKTTISDDKDRLNRRISNLNSLKQFIETHQSQATLMAFFGWGEGAEGANSNSGVSEYDTAYIKVNDQLVAFQLDSSIQVQNWNMMPDNQTTPKKDTIKNHTLAYSIDQSTQQLSRSFSYQNQRYIKTESTRPKIKHEIDLHPFDMLRYPFKILEVKHGHHSHFYLIDYTNKRVQLIGDKDEGCPCCMAGLDFDEFAAAISKMANSATSEEASLHSISHFDNPVEIGVAFGIALPFSVIGMTAAYRNMVGCWSNRKKIKKVIKLVDKEIKEIQRSSLSNKEQRIQNLNRYKESLRYSLFDTNFNFWVPGAINGVASGLVFSTIFWHNPFALPAISVYASAQLIRNLYDLSLVWNQKITSPATNSETEVLLQSQEMSSDDIQTDAPLKQEGIKKANQIARIKRKFYSSNALGFACFTAGALMTFLSLPALALGVGAATLPVGLSLLLLGAGSTGYLNNVYPQKFKPRNGDLGVDRRDLTPDTCLREIGKSTKMKRLLKKSKAEIVSPNHFKRFGYLCLTAMPSLPRWVPQKLRPGSGEKRRHQDNLRLFSDNKAAFKEKRTTLLRNLLEVSHSDAKVDNNLKSQWAACKKLGIQADILNLYLKEFDPNLKHCSSSHDHHKGHNNHSLGHSHGDNHGCSHDHSHGSTHTCSSGHDHSSGSYFKRAKAFIKRRQTHKHAHSHTHSGDCHNSHDVHEYQQTLQTSGIFDLSDDRNPLVSLKDTDKLKDNQQNALGAAIDFYLHHGFKAKLSYEERSLSDFFWRLKPTRAA